MKLESFNELTLSFETQQAITEMGFTVPSPIQAQAIPLLLENHDIIGQAQTGTGKTAAFGIPTVEKIDPADKNTQALILCPTRELAVQVAEEMKKLAKYKSKVFTTAIYGGESITKQISQLKRGIQIVIGTPGRVIDHITRGTLRLNNIKSIILDEADEMLNMGFKDDIEKILQFLPEERQTILFSATMPAPILEIAKKYQKEPKIVKVVNKELTNASIEQEYFSVKPFLKNELLTRLMDFHQWNSMLIFCNTKQRTAEIAEFLTQKGYDAEALHGDLAQNQRNVVMSKFRHGKAKILVATDVAARGIDVENVEAVINYDVPLDPEYYVHRIGRTGRAGKSGSSYTFISGREFMRLRDIENYTKVRIGLGTVPSIKTIVAKRYEQLEQRILQTAQEQQDTTTNFDKITEQLLAKGLSPEQIAKAALQLYIGNDLQIEDKDIEFAEEKGRTRDSRNTRETGKNPRGNGRFERHESRPTSKRRTDISMARLFINVGKQDRISKGDILGAISGETGINGRQIGVIDVYDKYSFVEVPQSESEKIMRLMNKAKIKGNKVSLEVAK
jgi:ATP-dependent RNA helicase DeaD